MKKSTGERFGPTGDFRDVATSVPRVRELSQARQGKLEQHHFATTHHDVDPPVLQHLDHSKRSAIHATCASLYANLWTSSHYLLICFV